MTLFRVNFDKISDGLYTHGTMLLYAEDYDEAEKVFNEWKEREMPSIVDIIINRFDIVEEKSGVIMIKTH